MDEVKIRSKLFPDKRTMEDLNKKSFSILTLIPRSAKENGVHAEFLEYNDGSLSNPLNGLYFIVTPDWQVMDSLKRNIRQFPDLLEEDSHRSPHMMNCYYNIIPLNDLNEVNLFSKHQAMCRAIQDTSIVANAFYEYGFPLPKQVHEQTVDNFYDYNEKRNDPSLTAELRKSYDKIMNKAVVDAYQLYSKQEALTKLPTRAKVDNRVPVDYFLKNHIETIYESVDRDFFEYIKEKMIDHPEFKYYKDNTPDVKIKDISSLSGKLKMIVGNPWADKKEIERYNIGFPTACEPLYYGWMVEYNTRNYDCKVPITDLERKTQGLLAIYIAQNDMYNFNSLCHSNNVQFAVNTGRYKDVTHENVRQVMVLFRMEDKPMVDAIVERLGRERRGYIPVNSLMKEKAMQNKPKENKNPYIEDKYSKPRKYEAMDI